jgi:general secretion pathway protein E
VLATLHTNDAVSAVTRLADMGVEPYLLASSVRGVLAQRLVRCLCAECREATAPSAGESEILSSLGLERTRHLYRPVGCASCSQSGYRGRTGIYELMLIDDSLSRLIHDRAGEPLLREACTRAKVRSLRSDGARWLTDGTTSLAELLRVTGAAS